MEEKKSFFEKVKEHKTEIIIGGFTIVLVVGAVLIIKSRDIIKGQMVATLFKNGTKINGDIIPHVTETIENTVISIQPNEKIVDVSKLIRNLPVGYKASSKKLQMAIESGIELNAN